MEIKFVSPGSVTESNAIFLVINNLEQLSEFSSRFGLDLKQMVSFADFKAKHLEQFTIPTGQAKINYIVICGAGDIDKIDENSLAEIGAFVTDAGNRMKIKNASVVLANDLHEKLSSELIGAIALGAKLRTYRFIKFITKKQETYTQKTENLHIEVKDPQNFTNLYQHKIMPVVEGVNFAKDLANEPPNILNPVSYAKICQGLEKFGLEVEVLDVEAMKKLGMGSLLGVGQGSLTDSRLVILKWFGASNKSEQPISFVGKGVTFDSGGLSLKPANNMMGMKFDMTGSAIVAGLMKTLALRKAKVNAIGVLGLVENMPSGNAQRPDDIVTSMSGQTIEILNTDAEGRLVLADALWYTQDRFKPKFMVNLATLTGAIIVTLADKYAGLFSNNDELSENLTKAGLEVDEKLWRLPLSDDYDKMIDSKIADMRNISMEKGAGSIIAAQFLQRFVNNVPWAHLDIAGVDNTEKANKIHIPGSSAFGVRLLNRFIEQNYEK